MSKFTQEVLTGINIAVKSISKKYPFIVGWELDSDTERYSHVIYIDIIVDKKKLSDYFEKPILRKHLDKVANFVSLFKNYDWTKDDETKKEWEQEWEYYYNSKREMEKSLDTIYSLIPDEYVLMTNTDTKVHNIRIDDFILK